MTDQCAAGPSSPFSTANPPQDLQSEWRFVLDGIGRRNATVLLVTVCAMSALDVAGIAVIFPFLTFVTQPSSTAGLASLLGPLGARLSVYAHAQLCLVLGGVLALFYVGKTAVQVVLTRVQSRLLARFTETLTNDLVGRVLSTRYAVFQQTPASQIAGTAYANTVHASIMLHALAQLLTEGLLLLLLLAGFFLVDPLLAAVAVALALLSAALLFVTVLRSTTQLGKAQHAVENVRYRLLFSIAQAIRDIKIMGLEGLFARRNCRASHEYAEISRRYNANNAVPRLLIELVAFVAIAVGSAAIVVFEVPFETAGPALGAAALAALRVAPALTKISTAVNSSRFSLPFVTRLIEMRALLSRATTERRDDKLSFDRSIELTNVGFSYPGKPVLSGVNLVLRRHESIGIVGASGAGKTTLLDLFTGLQQASEGRFLCDGTPYDPFTSGSMQKFIGYVPQSITLLDDTIAFNVTFEERPDPALVMKALAVANLTSLIDSLPQGIRTQVGENGLRLSGGQRQRIGIARALYRCPRILVFDEATSSLDAQTESELTKEIAKLRDQTSIVIVAHRLSTVADCDRIYVLAGGTVEASGRHAELLESSPTYRKLYVSQTT